MEQGVLDEAGVADGDGAHVLAAGPLVEACDSGIADPCVDTYIPVEQGVLGEAVATDGDGTHVLAAGSKMEAGVDAGDSGIELIHVWTQHVPIPEGQCMHRHMQGILHADAGPKRP